MSAKKKFKIRRCHDKKIIRWLHKRIFPSDIFYDKESLDWVVYSQAGKPVGFCMFAQESEHVGYLARAGVLPSHEGLGLHKRLIRVRERFARGSRFSVLITYTKITNIQSSANLQRLGYVLYIPEKEYADKDCLYWRKIIKKV